MQARTMHFLLEKSRLVSVAERERNYHVFYMLARGLAETAVGDALKLKAPGKYRMCSMGKCLDVSDEVGAGFFFSSSSSSSSSSSRPFPLGASSRPFPRPS